MDKYMDTATFKTHKNIYNTTLPSDMILTKANASTSDEKVEKLTKAFNIHYIYFIGSLIYLLSTTLDSSFTVHKLAKFSSNPDKVHFERFIHLLR